MKVTIKEYDESHNEIIASIEMDITEYNLDMTNEDDVFFLLKESQSVNRSDKIKDFEFDFVDDNLIKVIWNDRHYCEIEISA